LTGVTTPEDRREKKMGTSRRFLAVIATVALVIGGAVTVGPSSSYAGTINCITVTNGTTGGTFTGLFGAGGGTTGCATTAGTTWNLGAPIVLGDGQTAVLTQNQNNAGNSSLTTGLPGFNFDTSDKGTANYTISINGLAPVADANILNLGGVDNPDSTTLNEARDWTFITTLDLGGGHTLDIFTGYVDTLHSNACADASGNCLPTSNGPPTIPNTIFLNNANVALGNPTNIPGYPVSPHCDVGNANPITAGCFDAGAILFVEHVRATPEPSSLFLLGAGLMAAAAYGRTCTKRKS